jgi:transposase
MELTDEQWARIEPLLPPKRRGRGRPRADDRAVLNGILYVLRTGCRWEDVPRQYGSPATCWRRLHDWEAEGRWERIWQALLQRLGRARPSGVEQGIPRWQLEARLIPAKKGEPRSA